MKSKLWTVDNAGTVLVFAVIGGGLVAGGWPNITKHARALGERTGLVAKAPIPEPPGTAALKKAATACDAAAEKHLTAVRKFFDGKAANAGAFAERAVGAESGWEYLKSGMTLIGGDRDGHDQFLKREFEAAIFSPADVQRVIEQALAEYRKDLEGVDGRFVRDLQVDVPDSALLSPELVAKLQSPDTFGRAYGQLLAGVAPALQKEYGTLAVAQLTSFYAGNLAANGLLRVAAGAGIATAGWVPAIIANVAAGYVIDQLIDWLMGVVKDLTGFDPKGDVERAVRKAVTDLRDRVIDGDVKAVAEYDALRTRLADPAAGVNPLQQAQTRGRLDAVVQEKNIGLARQFALMKEARAAARKEIAKQAAGK